MKHENTDWRTGAGINLFSSPLSLLSSSIAIKGQIPKRISLLGKMTGGNPFLFFSALSADHFVYLPISPQQRKGMTGFFYRSFYISTAAVGNLRNHSQHQLA